MSVSLPYIHPSRSVLLIGDDALYIYKSGFTGTTLVDTVAWDAPDFESIVAEVIAKDCRSRPVLMLYDMVEQHYRKERLPRVGFLDKGGVLSRKLRMVFPQHSVRAALKLKERGGRAGGGTNNVATGGGLYLMAAISGGEAFGKLVEAVRRSMAPIAGFCLLPVEASDMVKTLADKLSRRAGTKAQWVVFVGQHQNGGLRQVVVRNGELALTRMTPVVDTDIDAGLWSDEIVQEFNATMSYLSRFGYSPEDGLEVVVIANPEAGELLEGKIEGQCHLTTMTVTEAARLLGVNIGKQDDERYADQLHVAWAGRKRSLTLPMQAREVSGIYKPRQAAMFFMLLLLAGMSYLLWQAYAVSQELTSLKDQLGSSQIFLTQVESQYREEVERKKAMGFDVELVQGTIEAYENLQQTDMKPLELFKSLGQSLGAEMSLDSLNVKRVVELVGDTDTYVQDKAESIFLEARFSMRMSASVGPNTANTAFVSLRNRIRKNMPDASVDIIRAPYDSSYNVEVSGSEGVVGNIQKEEDYMPEMLIRRQVK